MAATIGRRDTDAVIYQVTEDALPKSNIYSSLSVTRSAVGGLQLRPVWPPPDPRRRAPLG